jgi:hypothetical protein
MVSVPYGDSRDDNSWTEDVIAFGAPLRNHRFKPLVKRFWEKVEIRGEDECWPWLASVMQSGYGQFAMGVGRGMKPAHKIAYALKKGRVPDAHDVHHTCEYKLCCNPAHLEPREMNRHRVQANTKGA